MPSPERGLLARLDALVALAADRHGLALLPDGRLAAAEARVAVRATGLGARARPTHGRPSQPAAATPATPAARAEPAPQDPAVSRPPGGRGLALVERDAVELLRAVAEGVGLLRVRGDRLEATSLRHAWRSCTAARASRRWSAGGCGCCACCSACRPASRSASPG